MKVAENRKARFNYFIKDTYEAGISLIGVEVKALREKRVNMKDSYCVVENNEVFIKDLNISRYSHGSYDETYNPRRLRKLLLHKFEIKKIKTSIEEKGFTLIPLSVYFNDNNKVKIEVGIARGKHKYDKRETLKRKTMKREIEIAAKKYRNLKY